MVEAVQPCSQARTRSSLLQVLDAANRPCQQWHQREAEQKAESDACGKQPDEQLRIEMHAGARRDLRAVSGLSVLLRRAAMRTHLRQRDPRSGAATRAQAHGDAAARHLRSMSTEDVAMLLGFSDAANFRRALKRWTGKGPGESRK